MNLKPIRFSRDQFQAPGNFSTTAYRCSEPGDMSGEYFKADEVRERMAGLVRVLQESIEIFERVPVDLPGSDDVRRQIRENRAALAALPSHPQASRKETNRDT